MIAHERAKYLGAVACSLSVIDSECQCLHHVISMCRCALSMNPVFNQMFRIAGVCDMLMAALVQVGSIITGHFDAWAKIQPKKRGPLPPTV